MEFMLTNMISNYPFSQDSCCCVWSYQGHILQKLKGHKGKSIWSMCIDMAEKHVLTGGGDNSVRMWSLDRPAEQTSGEENTSLDLQVINSRAKVRGHSLKPSLFFT